MTRILLSGRTTGALSAFLAVMLLGSVAVSADRARTDYRQRLNSEMQRINEHYEDVKRELNEEYAAIAEEKDENCNLIFDKVRDLRAERKAVLDNFEAQRTQLRQTMAASNIPESDQRYIAQSSPLQDQEAQLKRAYDNSLETLQQLYQLNGKRYNELLKIHNAREALEENRFRELRDLTARSLQYDDQAARGNLSELDRRELDTRRTLFEAEQQRAQERYQTAVNALEEYRDLINDRIAAQHDYLTRYDAIMRDLARPELTAADRADYTEQLADLNAEKNAAERGYQNDVRYIEEKLNFERQRAREMSRIADDRRELELAWAQRDERYMQRRDQINQQLAQPTITPQAKQDLDTQMATLDQRYADARTAYNQAVDNLAQRESLAENALNQRMAYLRERNDIRVEMAQNPMTEENFQGFRDRIAQLEERRINEERDLRNQVSALTTSMPAAYRRTSYDSGNMQRRTSRALGRINEMKSNLQAKWDAKQQTMNEDIRALDQRLSAPNLSDSERQQIQTEKDEAQKRLDAAKERFDKAIQAVDERREREQKRMTARAEYMAKRRELRDNLSSDSLEYDDMVQYEQQLAELDRTYADQEKAYRKSARPLASLLPADAGDPNWQDRMEASWQRGLNRIRQEPLPDAANQANLTPAQRAAAANGALAGATPTAYQETPATLAARNATAARRAEQRRARRASGDGVWQSMKDAIVETYHDAVNYLTD